MTEPAIRVEGLSKQYQIGQREQYRALRETIEDAVKGPVRRVRSRLRGESVGSGSTRPFWALRDVSLEIAEGEIVGVIGNNGAGKSTLLKVLSRVTEPSAGRVDLRGRVGTLLEVGTGFHPELTGRENVYLYGAILGMKRQEIARKFDEIVAFSEVETFIDTPVKRYSSGMYLRLAFAVAAHLDPEILLIDEVLAVGDATFQRKCLGKMGEVAQEGRTVLFVSHNLPIVEKLCQRAVVMEAGRAARQGDPVSCINYYLHGKSVTGSAIDLAAMPRPESRLTPVLRSLELLNGHGAATSSVGCGEPLTFRITYNAPSDILNPTFGIIISNALGTPLFFLQTRAQIGLLDRLPPTGELSCHLDRVPLVPGEYLMTVGCSTGERQLDLLEQVARFSVEPRDYWNTGHLPHPSNGPVMVDAAWDIRGGPGQNERSVDALAYSV